MSAVVVTSTKNMTYKEWLNWRKKGIGGSDASVVCGVNKYKSLVELFMEKTDSIEFEQQAPEEAGDSAYWGKVLESVVRAEFTKRTGIPVAEATKLLRCKE